MWIDERTGRENCRVWKRKDGNGKTDGGRRTEERGGERGRNRERAGDDEEKV